MTEEDLTKEEKVERLEKIADEIGLDIEEVVPDGQGLEDLGLTGTIEVKVYDDEDELKEKREVEL